MTNFPAKLHYILGEMEKDGQSDIMSWQSSGESFVVHDKARLEATILPQWFRQSKFSSFQRQLNIYGFQRISEGLHKGGYQHQFFRRDEPHLCANMPRCRKKGKLGNCKRNGAIRGHLVETVPTQQQIPSQVFYSRNKIASELNGFQHGSSSRTLMSDAIEVICGFRCQTAGDQTMNSNSGNAAMIYATSGGVSNNTNK